MIKVVSFLNLGMSLMPSVCIPPVESERGSGRVSGSEVDGERRGDGRHIDSHGER